MLIDCSQKLILLNESNLSVLVKAQIWVQSQKQLLVRPVPPSTYNCTLLNERIVTGCTARKRNFRIPLKSHTVDQSAAKLRKRFSATQPICVPCLNSPMRHRPCEIRSHHAAFHSSSQSGLADNHHSHRRQLWRSCDHVTASLELPHHKHHFQH